MRGLIAMLILAAGVWIVNGWIARQLYKSNGETTAAIEKRNTSA
jgi:hypothetical protein